MTTQVLPKAQLDLRNFYPGDLGIDPDTGRLYVARIPAGQVSALGSVALTDEFEGAPAAHRSSHISGGSDAFLSTDILESAARRLRTGDAVTLTVGTLVDGQFLRRNGTTLDTAAEAGELDPVFEGQLAALTAGVGMFIGRVGGDLADKIGPVTATVHPTVGRGDYTTITAALAVHTTGHVRLKAATFNESVTLGAATDLVIEGEAGTLWTIPTDSAANSHCLKASGIWTRVTIRGIRFNPGANQQANGNQRSISMTGFAHLRCKVLYNDFVAINNAGGAHSNANSLHLALDGSRHEIAHNDFNHDAQNAQFTLTDGGAAAAGGRHFIHHNQIDIVSNSNGIVILAAGDAHTKVIENHVAGAGIVGISIQIPDCESRLNTCVSMGVGFEYATDRISSSGNRAYSCPSAGFNWTASRADQSSENDVAQACGIGHLGDRPVRLNIVGARSTSCTGDGFDFTGLDRCTFSKCRASLCGGHGFDLGLDAAHVCVDSEFDVYASNCTGTGFRMTDGGGAVVTGSHLTLHTVGNGATVTLVGDMRISDDSVLV